VSFTNPKKLDKKIKELKINRIFQGRFIRRKINKETFKFVKLLYHRIFLDSLEIFYNSKSYLKNNVDNFWKR